MPRNGSGLYTLPTGNPVIPGTTISATTHNLTMDDVALALSQSLSRIGQGDMTAPLKLPNGSAAAPSLAFTNDPDCGLFRVGTNDIGLSISGGQIAHFLATSIEIASTVTFTQSSANAAAITAIGNGSGSGVTGQGGATGSGLTGTGGATSGNGVVGTGGPNGHGLFGNGGSNGNAVGGLGNGTGAGGSFTGGATGVGVAGLGGGTQAGGTFANGTAATGGTRRNAALLTNGDLAFSGVAAPTKTTALSNALTPTTLLKAWGLITIAGGGGVGNFVPTFVEGASITSVTRISSTRFRVTWATAFATSNYSVRVDTRSVTTSRAVAINSTITTTTLDFEIQVVSTGNATDLDATAATFVLDLSAYGHQ